MLAPWTLLSGYCLYRRIGYITGSVNGLLSLDQSHKSHDAPVQCPTMHCSEQKCAHFCTEWCIEGSGISALWDLWIWSTAPLEITFIELWIKVGKFSVKLNAFKNAVCKIVAILFLNVLTPFFSEDFAMRWLFTAVLLFQAVTLIQCKFLELSEKLSNELLV